MNRTFRALVVSAVCVLALVSAEARAALIADFTADFQSGMPKAGWAYQRSLGGIGTYVDLVYNADNDWYTADGTEFGPEFNIIGSGFVHPGNQDRYTVARYTLSAGGPTTLDALTLTMQGVTGNGIELFVNVNDGPNLVPIANRLIASGGSYTGPTTIDLGTLLAGDRVYVAIGANGEHSGDSTNLQFQINTDIVPIPEPSSALLLAFGALGLVRTVRRRASHSKAMPAV